MRKSNLIDLAAHRARAVLDDAGVRHAQRDADRSKEADELLRELHQKKRIELDDRPILARNLGRMVLQIEPKTPMAVAERILQLAWPKRKRYIRFPKDPSNPSTRYAASGGDFAGIIQRLAQEKVRVGLDHAQAMKETVYDALKGSSFLPPPRFHLPQGVDDSDAAYFVSTIEKVFDKVAQDADLAEHFKLISKYPIYSKSRWEFSLEMRADEEPNNLFSFWDECQDEYHLQTWIPWWAPRCVIGHLYIRFECSCFDLPEHSIAEINKLYGGEISRDEWIEHGISLLESVITPDGIHPHKVFHRLPVWLIMLPSPTGLAPCLYASIYHQDSFHIKQLLEPENSDEAYFSHLNVTTPCFVDWIGERLTDDAVYFRDDQTSDWGYSYIHISKNGIKAIGYGVDPKVDNFEAEFTFADYISELPDWLYPHPVQRLLKLTMDSEEAKFFALSPRSFPRKWNRDSETVFRPAFSDSLTQFPGLRPNTIAAFLLRNSVNEGNVSIFEALKNDAVAKAAAAREVIDHELLKFQAAFDSRYGK
jgi:hypothetical protein